VLLTSNVLTILGTFLPRLIPRLAELEADPRGGYTVYLRAALIAKFLPLVSVLVDHFLDILVLDALHAMRGIIDWACKSFDAATRR
jgi:hypothetical protein